MPSTTLQQDSGFGIQDSGRIRSQDAGRIRNSGPECWGGNEDGQRAEMWAERLEARISYENFLLAILRVLMYQVVALLGEREPGEQYGQQSEVPGRAVPAIPALPTA